MALKPDSNQAGDDGMGELYSPDASGKDQPQSVDQEEREEMNEQAAMPLAVLTYGDGEPPKQGDVCKIRIDKVDGDMALVSRVKDDQGGDNEEEESQEGENPPSEMSPDDELEELGKQY